jgi:predicted nucleic acid-binding protein
MRPALGSGEREALAMALESRPSHVILDDLPARRLALKLGVPLIGTLGILVAAKESGLIITIRPHLDMLAKRRFFMSEELYREFMAAAGEPIE